MPTLTPKEFFELTRQYDLANTPLFQQPRGLSVPTPKPPADLLATPGVQDSAERTAQRAMLIAKVRRQQEELPIVAADQAFRGAVVGGIAGLGCLLLRGLLTSTPPEMPRTYEEDYDE
jgi:hypothetical protein